MSATTAVNAIRARLKTEWAALHPTFPVIDAGRPSSDSTRPPTDLPWVKFSIGFSAEGQAWMSSPRGFRQSGTVLITVFIPRGPKYADGDLLGYADEIAALFTGETISGIRFEPERQQGVRLGAPSDDPDGPYRSLPVFVPYEYEFTKA